MANVAIFSFCEDTALLFHVTLFQFDQLTVFVDKTAKNSIANIFVFVSNNDMYDLINFLLIKWLNKDK